MQHLQVSEIKIDVIQKDIKNLHLSVHPPYGRVKISAPTRMDLETIRIYAISKLGWIRNHQSKFKNQERETPREFISNESHFFKGKRYLLRVIEKNSKPEIILRHNKIELYIRPGSGREKKREIFEDWYREKLKEVIPGLIKKWEGKMNLNVKEFGIKKMKTKWGTCNSKEKRIWLNLELAKKPVICLEYIIVHEMIHLIERKHNERFVSLMDKYMPQWREIRGELGRLPVGDVR